MFVAAPCRAPPDFILDAKPFILCIDFSKTAVRKVKVGQIYNHQCIDILLNNWFQTSLFIYKLFFFDSLFRWLILIDFVTAYNRWKGVGVSERERV